ncbi:hypothetical protein [Arabidopsis thaliana]|jgi:hypothetical protein|uniref:Probable disease resistance protein At4g19060 n=5 Tax=Arabidopsis TaxID=3701 RepID=DRL26_ARATH|nr:P-loop containing nucleoside triphosphate hydrolases superfamily protein [Arabidopsis thaliana]Q84WD3.2 RecName: Full=Probable disease resistance protein At4g19060 [Arabidopsis thaliana]KAG7616561.1 P-loop containing nucleoside triphosphate hydrolase [Arabidopsis thaliana x Arabidopsis arenosa]AAY25406.1 At4g19060 [Arabidopsis thaliana]AEE84135.1 P-loop containing nucleoside triphosphate hydrolases superfamily protein [Arabidopsis thaliana]OAO99879.1 hypothetical protein AXX17_AT4G22470 [Ar|eukprot:NP_193641.1 P-loop containing nucleoside triphosphate hydrolases superfamily protein [Arabidopsis thaliana]
MDIAKKFISEIDDKLESKSEFDKELEKIKSSFNEEYEKWSSGKQRGSSSKHGNQSTHGDSSPTRNSSGSSKKGRPKANRVETSSELPDHLIRGFINEKLFLKNFLLKQKESEEFKTLAIVGKYGVGKTTLCQAVFNDEDVKQVYFPRIWVSMYSKETKEDEDPKIDVVKRILRSLGVEDEMFKHIKTEAEEEKSIKDEAGEREEETVKEKELARLLYALHLNLIGKKYLIVLDDVWEDNEWDQRLDDEKKQQEKSHLSCGFPKGFGGKVIMTSRDERLAKAIVGEEENLQRLFPRSDAESLWEIYIDAVPTKVDDAAATNLGDAVATNAGDAVAPKVNPRYPGRYKQELMDKSCGIPLAARMLAKIEPVKVDEIGNIDRKQSF